MENNIIIFTNRKSHNKKGKNYMQTLDTRRKRKIEKIVYEILKKNGFEDASYVDIVSIVKNDDFKVIPMEMDIETTGCLLVGDKNQERKIMVNTKFKNEDNEDDVVFKKSRFITAHEYGHYILHNSGKPILAHRDTYHRKDIKEQEADYFARSLLLPKKQFALFYNVANDIWKEDKDFIFEILSKIFKVTRKKIRKRVEDLAELK